MLTAEIINKSQAVQWNPNFSKLQGKRKLVRKIGQFEKSGVKLKCSTEEGKRLLVRVYGRFEKMRVREIRVPLYVLCNYKSGVVMSHARTSKVTSNCKKRSRRHFQSLSQPWLKTIYNFPLPLIPLKEFTIMGHIKGQGINKLRYMKRQGNLSFSYLKRPLLRYFEQTHLTAISFNLLSTT